MDKEFMKPVAWIERYAGGGVAYDKYSDAVFDLPEGVRIELYPSQPMPRDVLMAFGEAVRDALIGAWTNAPLTGVNPTRDELTAMQSVSIAVIADRYASQVQPEPACQHRIADARNQVVASGYLCVDCGALFSAVDHGVQKQPNPEPVNQQLLAALKRLLHKAYKQNWQDNYPSEVECAEAAIAAAEAAQPGGVPEEWQAAMAFARAALAEAIQIAPLDRLPPMAGAAMQQIDTLLSALQNDGAA